MLSKKIEKEIKNINNYEKLWKIRTNTQKFTLLPIAIQKTEKVNINGNNIPYKKEAKVLGLKINNRGYNKHVKEVNNKASIALNTIQKFSKLSTNIKLHLVKACVLPILTYPAYVLNALPKTQIQKLQTTQNRALRYVHNERYPYTKNTIELHEMTNTEPINKIIHLRGNQLQHKLTHVLQDPTYTNTIHDHDQYRNHSWFRKPITNITKQTPPPKYT